MSRKAMHTSAKAKKPPLSALENASLSISAFSSCTGRAYVSFSRSPWPSTARATTPSFIVVRVFILAGAARARTRMGARRARAVVEIEDDLIVVVAGEDARAVWNMSACGRASEK